MKKLGVDFQDNPELAAAELIIHLNPEYEKVAVDEAAGTMTVRDKNGAEKTLTFEDIAESRFDRATVEAPEPVLTE